MCFSYCFSPFSVLLSRLADASTGFSVCCGPHSRSDEGMEGRRGEERRGGERKGRREDGIVVVNVMACVCCFECIRQDY